TITLDWFTTTHPLTFVLQETQQIFNTNITGVPVTRAQVFQILEKQAACSEESIELSSIPIILPPTSRRSVSSGPSIDMN
ncbi:hypothetical protein Trydic_g11987, partial [Trypoxylus dichotomus]